MAGSRSGIRWLSAPGSGRAKPDRLASLTAKRVGSFEPNRVEPRSPRLCARHRGFVFYRLMGGEDRVFSWIREEIKAVFDRDPAARSVWEVLFCYPGFHAMCFHRVAHWFYRREWYFLARLISHISRFLTGVEIHPGARIGRGLFIDHGMGVVIGETTEIGDNVTLYKGVVLGGTGKEGGKRHPTLGENVVVSSNAVILGSITIGENCKIGAGAVVLHSVPPGCTVVGVPGRIVRREGRKVEGPDLDQVNLPDPVAEMLFCLQKDLNYMEKRLRELEGKANSNEGGNQEVERGDQTA